MNTNTETPWRAGVDSPVWLKPRRTVYFIHQDGNPRYGKSDRLITYRSLEAAQRAAEKLNTTTP